MSNYESNNFLLPLHFNGHQIRAAIDERGMAWWVAQDIGERLGIQNVRQNLAEFPADEKSVCTVYTNAGPREVLTVSEPGLYRLIFQSRKPEADALKRWVFHDILPSIRRTGSYAIPQEADQLTPEGQLPPPVKTIKEHAEVSWHMAAIWRLLCSADEWLSNREIARRSDVNERTVRAHTRYFRQLGVLEVSEYFPNHLYRLAADAASRNPSVFQRMEMITQIIAERRRP